MKGLADNQETAQVQLRNAQAQLDLTRQGQITERFESAIAQLGAADDGNPRLEVRLGGIYALEQIAKDSTKYYGPVIEVLTAYVRQNAPWPPKPQKEKDTEEDSPSEPRPPADIQAILDVLMRREEDRVPERYCVHIDLQDTDLRGAQLRRLERRDGETRFSRTNLREAYFFRADLSWARLTAADLQSAGFVGANLKFADLQEADLQGAYISGADLQGADLQGANLRGVDLRKANLESAVLDGVDLRETIFRGINPDSLRTLVGEGAEREDNLSNAYLDGADLEESISKKPTCEMPSSLTRSCRELTCNEPTCRKPSFSTQTSKKLNLMALTCEKPTCKERTWKEPRESLQSNWRNRLNCSKAPPCRTERSTTEELRFFPGFACSRSSRVLPSPRAYSATSTSVPPSSLTTARNTTLGAVPTCVGPDEGSSDSDTPPAPPSPS